MSKSMNRNIDPEWMNLAWKQASLIHHREEIIDRIVSDAFSELSVTATKQSKRLYSKTKESKRIYLERIHLFQRLVFLKSESPEKDQEIFAPDSVSEGDMIIRFLALIVRKIMKRNSLYGVTGVCRFICNYQLKDVRTIHDALVDENGHKEDDDFRKNKQSMLKMIIERFQDHLRVEEAQNGKGKHFIRRRDQQDSSLVRLVRESLDAFKPWRTECLSACFSPDDAEHNFFTRPVDPDVLEIRRLHTLIHQDCFSAFAKVKDLDAPDTRLGIPQFFFGNQALSDGEFEPPSGRSGNSSDNESAGPSSRGHMLEEVRKRLDRQDERLGRFIPEGQVIVRVDGREAASFNLDSTASVQFTVDDEDAERMEIVAHDEQLVLAVHLLDDEVWHTENLDSLYEVHHVNGMKVMFAFRQITDHVSHQNRLSVTVTYRETDPRRYFAYWVRRLKNRASSWTPVPELSPTRYDSKDGLLQNLLVTLSLLLIIALSTYTAAFTHKEPAAELNPRLEFWGVK